MGKGKLSWVLRGNWYNPILSPHGMKIKNGKIVESTEKALYSHWLEQEFDDMCDFATFKEKMETLGVKIV